MKNSATLSQISPAWQEFPSSYSNNLLFKQPWVWKSWSPRWGGIGKNIPTSSLFWDLPHWPITLQSSQTDFGNSHSEQRMQDSPLHLSSHHPSPVLAGAWKLPGYFWRAAGLHSRWQSHPRWRGPSWKSLHIHYGFSMWLLGHFPLFFKW